MIRTPYDKRLLGSQGLEYRLPGFAVAIQDVRGRWQSGGTWQPFLNEGRDGYDTIEWLADQPGSSGRVGMVGGSYAGSVQHAAPELPLDDLATGLKPVS